MNSVGKLLMKRKRAMTINQIADAAFVSRSHAKNSVTSERDMYSWLPYGHYIKRSASKQGTKYQLVKY